MEEPLLGNFGPAHPPRPTPAATPIAPGLLRISTAAGDFLAAQRRRGIEDGTLSKYRQALWSLLEFLACDSPTQELVKDDLARAWLTWLRETPAAPRKAGALPREITPDTVRHFLASPPARAAAQEHRSEQTIGGYWRHVRKFLASIGCSTELDRRDKPNLALPPPLVPSPAIVRGWWSEYLRENRPRTQRIVLMQALLMLTGMRLGEALAARLDDVEGHWLLVRESKTHKPRILYLNSRALGIAQALRQRYTEPLLFPIEDAERLAGWPHSVGYWHNCVRAWSGEWAGYPRRHEQEKRHQAMRQVCSTFLFRRNPTAESLQLGHGSGVVLKHYVDAMRMIPPILEKFALPAGEAIGIAWPQKIKAARGVPARLYEEFRKLVSRRRTGPLG